MTISPVETVGKISSLLTVCHKIFVVSALDGGFNSSKVWEFMIINWKKRSSSQTEPVPLHKACCKGIWLHTGLMCINSLWLCLPFSRVSVRAVFCSAARVREIEEDNRGIPLQGNHMGKSFSVIMSLPQCLFHCIHKNLCPLNMRCAVSSAGVPLGQHIWQLAAF